MMLNCPNCGAPVNGRECPYCGTMHAMEVESVTIEHEAEYVDIMDWSGHIVYRILAENTTKVTPNEFQ